MRIKSRFVRMGKLQSSGPTSSYCLGTASMLHQSGLRGSLLNDAIDDDISTLHVSYKLLHYSVQNSTRCRYCGISKQIEETQNLKGGAKILTQYTVGNLISTVLYLTELLSLMGTAYARSNEIICCLIRKLMPTFVGSFGNSCTEYKPE